MVKILKTWNIHGEKVGVPDQSQYKIEGTKLEAVRDRLASKGLKSPWLRNAAWRYHPEWHHARIWPPFFRLMFTGAPIALGIVAFQAVATEVYNRVAKVEEHHFHGFTKYVPKVDSPASE